MAPPEVANPMAAKRHSPPPKDLSGQQQNLVFWCLAIAVFACGVDSAALHGHLPVIVSQLDGGAFEACGVIVLFYFGFTWSLSAFRLAVNECGCKLPLVIALAIFPVGSVHCATAPNIRFFLVGRVIQGTGVGGIMALSGWIIDLFVPHADHGSLKRWVTSMFAACFVGIVSEVVLTAALAKPQHWRLIFWVNAAVCESALMLTLFFSELPKVKKEEPRSL